MKAYDIVGYTFDADTYCPECVLDIANEWLYADGVKVGYMRVEDALDAWATSAKITRDDEWTFDSGDFPKVVFCDSVPTHDRIVASLVASGIPREQIGVINAQVASTSAARQRVSDDFNAGKLKVVVGNTATMGEGVNLQKGTTDIHHLDLPWEPASVQQRNGRGQRQGNKNESIRIHTYLAKGSFDGYRWQTIAAKKDWMDLLWNGGARVENLSRQGGVGRQDMLIMLSADPEAARAKYEGDKTAAEQRKLAEARGESAVQFERLQRMPD